MTTFARTFFLAAIIAALPFPAAGNNGISYTDSHPKASDVYLVVEVADTTLAFDLGTKVPLYARCGITEAWVVDANERVIQIFREPGPTGYSTSLAVKAGQSVACVALPETILRVEELFP